MMNAAEWLRDVARFLLQFVIGTGTMTIRVLLLSDTHGFLDARIAALARTCDYAVHAGDIGNGAVLAQLQPRRRTVAVRGNNDTPGQWPDNELDCLANLPTSARLTLPGGTLAVIHGNRAGPVSRRHERLRDAYGDCRAVVYGHSHRLTLDTEYRPWVLNPGAAGRARTYGGPSCVLLTAHASGWTVEAHRFTPA